MSSGPLYSSLRATVRLALTLATVAVACAQAPHGPVSFEQIVDASYSGKPTTSPNHYGQEPIHSEQIHAEPIHVDPMLDDRRTPPPAGPAGEPISLGRIKHAPPAKAVKQMLRAQEAFQAGDDEKGVKRLKQAIEIHPNYIEARNNLGVRYSIMGRWSDAAKQFEKASELDPAAALPRLNLAVALQALGEEESAVINAEEAVRLAPHDVGMNYNLGAILAQQGRRLDDAVRHLSRAESVYPKAKLVKAEAFLQMGQSDDAQKELRQFLAQGGDALR